MEIGCEAVKWMTLTRFLSKSRMWRLLCRKLVSGQYKWRMTSGSKID
jgi:hypothetical protein